MSRKSQGKRREAPAVQRGAVGYLAVKGQLQPVRVTSVEGSRLRTVGLDEVERIVSADRLYWLGEARLGDDATLASYWERIQSRMADCDPEMAWELLADDEALEPMDLEDLAEIIPGGRSPEDLDALAVAIFHDPLYFKLKKGRVQPASRRAIEEMKRQKAEEERRARELEAATRILRGRLAGEQPDASEAPEILPDDADERQRIVERHLEALIDRALHGKEASEGALADEILRRLDRAGPGDAARRAFELLVDLGEFHPDENLVVRRAGVRRRFPHAVAREAEAIAAHASAPAERRDRRELLTVAVDDANTTEVDDAFAFDGERLYVFIADAAEVVPAEGEVDREASKRTSTLYLPEGKIPMLPPILGDRAASLEEGEDRPALCFSGDIDEAGRLTGFDIEEVVCRVDRRMTYDEADALLERDGDGEREGDEPVETLLRRARNLMERHRLARAEQGALMLRRREVDIRVDEEGTVSIHTVDANGPARNLVSEMMVAACAATAEFCREQEVPCVYRAQPAPDDPVDPSKVRDDDPAAQIQILRRLKPATLTTVPSPHFTLGVEAYTQITSPIRRYADLLMHRQLKSVLRHRQPRMTEQELMGIFDEVERATGVFKRVEQETRRYWILRYLEQNPDRVWDAVAIRDKGKKWQVEIPELAFQADVQPQRTPEAGQALRLRVEKVDARRDKLVLHEA